MAARSDLASGFTLLEVMIAFVIAALAIAALLQAGGTGLSATSTAALYGQALSHAQSHLEAAAHGAPLAPSDHQGDDGGGFHWRVRVTPAASTTIQRVGTVPRPPLTVTLYTIGVWISWQSGGHVRQVHLETQQIGRYAR
jgi:general secretion pathway protein I